MPRRLLALLGTLLLLAAPVSLLLAAEHVAASTPFAVALPREGDAWSIRMPFLGRDDVVPVRALGVRALADGWSEGPLLVYEAPRLLVLSEDYPNEDWKALLHLATRDVVQLNGTDAYPPDGATLGLTMHAWREPAKLSLFLPFLGAYVQGETYAWGETREVAAQGAPLTIRYEGVDASGLSKFRMTHRFQVLTAAGVETRETAYGAWFREGVPYPEKIGLADAEDAWIETVSFSPGAGPAASFDGAAPPRPPLPLQPGPFPRDGPGEGPRFRLSEALAAADADARVRAWAANGPAPVLTGATFRQEASFAPLPGVLAQPRIDAGRWELEWTRAGQLLRVPVEAIDAGGLRRVSVGEPEEERGEHVAAPFALPPALVSVSDAWEAARLRLGAEPGSLSWQLAPAEGVALDAQGRWLDAQAAVWSFTSASPSSDGATYSGDHKISAATGYPSTDYLVKFRLVV